jgi:hypothetical protein
MNHYSYVINDLKDDYAILRFMSVIFNVVGIQYLVEKIILSAAGIATGYGMDDRGVGVQVPIGEKIFSTSSGPVLGPTEPPIKWIQGDLSPGVKQPGREADHSPPTSAEVKNTWMYISNPPYVFMA